MFEMNVNPQKKAFIIKVGGFFEEEEAKRFMEAYNKNINSIKASEYSLIIVADELSTTKPEVIPALEDAVNMYKSSGFKAYYCTTPKSAVTGMQLKRITNNSGINFTFEPTVEDVLRKL